jgi:hypothetical protein
MTGNKRMLSAFVNQMLEEFILEGEEQPETSIRQKAREMADKIRNEKLSQRKLVNDAETERIEREKKEVETRAFIEQQTHEAVRKLAFKPEWLRDRNGLNFSHHRKELEDEVSINCRMDLQWKELMPIVSAIVLSGNEGVQA